MRGVRRGLANKLGTPMGTKNETKLLHLDKLSRTGNTGRNAIMLADLVKEQRRTQTFQSIP